MLSIVGYLVVRISCAATIVPAPPLDAGTARSSNFPQPKFDRATHSFAGGHTEFRNIAGQSILTVREKA